MKKKLLEYIKSEIKKETKHFSYCPYPESDCECIKPKNLNYNTPLISSGILDSFSVLVLLVFIEKEFGVNLDSLGKADNINDIYGLILK